MADLDPAIWSALPEELLYVIFAHLPAVNILRLSALSKEWEQNLKAYESKFRQVCAEAQAKIFGVVCERETIAGLGSYLLRFFDTRDQQWHILQGATGGESPLDTILGATDGGLVCMIERKFIKDKSPLVIVVSNPLTGVVRPRPRRHPPALPDGSLTEPPCMVQLVMDADSQAYKLLVVGPHVGQVEVYYSASDSWRSPESLMSTGLVFGQGYLWEQFDKDDDESYFDIESSGHPCVYDCADGGRLFQLEDDSYPCSEESVIYNVLSKDRLFVLHALGTAPDLEYVMPDGSTDQRRCGPYLVTEYQGQKARPHWRKLRDYRPTIDAMFPNSTDKYDMRLYACPGILLVTASARERRHDRGRIPMFCSGEHGNGDFAQFCDLSESEEKWQNIPALPDVEHYITAFPDETMCELRWGVLP